MQAAGAQGLGLQKPAGDGLQQLRPEEAPAPGFDVAAKLVPAHAGAGKVDLAQVAGEDLVGQAVAGGDGAQLAGDEGHVVLRLGRGGKLHLHAGGQVFQCARLKLVEQAVFVGLQLRRDIGQAVHAAEAHETRGQAHALALGVLVVGDVAHGHVPGAAPRHAADLVGSLSEVEVQDLIGGNEDAGGHAAALARVTGEEPVANAAVLGIKLHAELDVAAAGQVFILGVVEVVGFQDAQFQGRRVVGQQQVIRGQAPLTAHQDLARLGDGAHELLLQAIAVQAAIGITGGGFPPGGPALLPA